MKSYTVLDKRPALNQAEAKSCNVVVKELSSSGDKPGQSTEATLHLSGQRNDQLTGAKTNKTRLMMGSHVKKVFKREKQSAVYDVQG